MVQKKEEFKELRFVCTRCGNCCIDKNTLVNLTYSDILRIKNGLKLTVEEILEILGFYIFDKKPTEEETKKMVVPPLETERGLAFIGLKKDSSGKCYFYNDKRKKCLIYKIRPMFCRTFPFTFRIFFNKENPNQAKIKMQYTEKGMKYCPGIGDDNPLIDEDEWIKVGKTTIEEMSANNVLIEKWNEVAKKGKIKPTAKNFVLTILKLEQKNSKLS
ncbi:MAG: YkgJ family cysteine cluster protein [Promethearchaeota archaeon]